jgi:hypothetical protein
VARQRKKKKRCVNPTAAVAVPEYIPSCLIVSTLLPSPSPPLPPPLPFRFLFPLPLPPLLFPSPPLPSPPPPSSPPPPLPSPPFPLLQPPRSELESHGYLNVNSNGYQPYRYSLLIAYYTLSILTGATIPTVAGHCTPKGHSCTTKRHYTAAEDERFVRLRALAASTMRLTACATGRGCRGCREVPTVTHHCWHSWSWLRASWRWWWWRCGLDEPRVYHRGREGRTTRGQGPGGERPGLTIAPASQRPAEHACLAKTSCEGQAVAARPAVARAGKAKGAPASC